MRSYKDQKDDFLKHRHLFQLGGLITERPNPRTENLSELCQFNLAQACRVFRDVEIDALQTLLDCDSLAQAVVESFRKAIGDGSRIFFVGCGATGRLALVLEAMWRSQAPMSLKESVIAFTAGGDYALVRSMGVFEDRQELGGEHLQRLGFREGDLLIAVTEGGETPFVLGALEHATRLSAIKPWLFFCNPAILLAETAERSKRALENPRVRWHDFQIAPMALTGSTRLQACSVLMSFLGACLEEILTRSKPKWIFSETLDLLYRIDPTSLIPLIEREAETHLLSSAEGFSLHRSRSAAMAVLTDTTERAPTFSLAPFETSMESQSESNLHSLSKTYLEIPGTNSSQDAWLLLLGREPRPFSPPDDVRLPDGRRPEIEIDQIYGFDFSDSVLERRKAKGIQTSLIIEIEFGQADQLAFQTLQPGASAPLWECRFQVGNSLTVRQSLLKYLLNLQSTLAMGRIGRFHGNLMTYVKPTNGKLIDRALRTLRTLSGQSRLSSITDQAHSLTENELLSALFRAMEEASVGEPVALKALEILQNDRLSQKR
jgi:N-acetylmuramic acid 6-phosphate etherase